MRLNLLPPPRYAQMKRSTPLCYLLATVFCAGLAYASAGDRSLPFQQCLDVCNKQPCTPDALSWSLRLTRWSCADDCAYTCMHQVTDEAVRDHRPIEQFYGKWPFWRWAGMQEPASVFFSLLNLWAHWWGFKRIRDVVPKEHSLRGYLRLWSVVSMNAWVWSAVFHTRDNRRTEEMDYFSAALVFVVSLNFIVSRFFFINRPQRHSLRLLWNAACILTYLAHVSYLHFSTRFDYSYNIIFNLVIGLVHNALWLLYGLPSSMTVLRRFPPPATHRSYRPRCARRAVECVFLTMAAMSLELLDFPPIKRVLDAHALWHASTAGIAVVWYGFLIEDAMDDGWMSSKASLRL